MRLDNPFQSTDINPQSGFIILDSGYPNSGHGRYTIVASEPIKTLSTDNRITTITDHLSNTITQHTDDSLSLLEANTPNWHAQPHLPFSGGWLGYFGYETAWQTTYSSKAPDLKKKDLSLPDCWFGLYAWAIIFDHYDQSIWLSYPSNGLCPESTLINSLQKWPFTTCPKHQFTTGEIHSNLTFNEYEQRFNQAKAQITLGNCYQVNLAQRFQCDIDGTPWQVYQQLRHKNPAQYGAFIQLEDQQAVLSLSPELFIHANSGSITTKPIKGTRPRGSTAVQDQQLITELATSQKDQAENVMIVDLMRNDLSHCCQPGSIEVSELFAIETLPAVHHLVSTITGQLLKPQDLWTLLRACLPGGSITGAPKLSAMQIINALEPHQRNVYCGNIGWIAPNGDCCLNIAIRTLTWDHNQLFYHAGGGIVADSTLEAEYQETFNKVAKIIAGLTTHN